MLTIWEILLRLLVSIVLSGIIGIERESIKKPAGFRTHILVCVGSTLVMLISIYIFEIYKFETTLQPDRLGAQVISGIGFLGAGTIIKEGSTIKGLTTAAGLWAMAAIGLAVGAGFYTGAIITTILVLFTLVVFSKVERHIKSSRDLMSLNVVSINKPGQLGKIGKNLGDLNIDIINIEMQTEDNELISINMIIRVPERISKIDILSRIRENDDILEVSDSR